MKPKLKVGFDLDGVLLTNMLGSVRPLLKYFRKNILHKKSTGSYTPRTPREEFINYLYIKLSYFKMKGFDGIIKLIDEGKIEAYIITGRHSSYQKEFFNSVNRLNSHHHFVDAFYNKEDLEPYEFKLKMIKDLDLDLYVEDNLDVVNILSKKLPGKILWITNPIDRHINYPLKFNDLNGIGQYVNKINPK